MPQRPQLTDITVCAADCVHPDLAARALEKCTAACAFGDAILFSDKKAAGNFRTIPIGPLRSRDEYSRFCLHGIAPHITTPFALIVQWDGYVVEPALWNPAFLEFDYIGAPWKADGVVGNGGFSLRSRRLLDLVRSLPLLPGIAEDLTISRHYRQLLERAGMRFPTGQQAARFSYEQEVPAEPTFGFHAVYNLLRHESDDELVKMASRLTVQKLSTWPYFCLVAACLEQGRETAGAKLYAFARAHIEPDVYMVQAPRNNRMSAEAMQLTIDRLELERHGKPR